MLYVLLLLLFLLGMWLFDRRMTSYEHLPGPKRRPFVGNLMQFLGIGAADIFERLITYSKQYGGIYKFDFVFDYTIVCSSPEAAKTILTSCDFGAKSEDYDKVSEWIGNGLLVSRGNDWLLHRKIMTSAFDIRSVEHFVPLFNRHAELFCAKLEALLNERPDTPINVLPELKLHTLNVLCQTAMGIEGGEDEGKRRRYTQVVAELTSILYWRMFDCIASFNVFFRLTPTSRRFRELVKESHSFTQDMIDRRRKIKETAQSVELPTTSEPDKQRRKVKPLIDTLMDARLVDGKPLTDKEIREEVDTISFAGYDTTASAMTFILYNVGKYPEMQERLYDEIVSVAGTEFGELSASDACLLSYMDLFIKESLRLFPPVPIVARTATADTHLLYEKVNRGTAVALNIFSMHRHPDYFPNPELFDPERTYGDNVLPCTHYAYIPFSAGPRNCIGQKFALYELKTTLVKVLQKFQLRLIGDNYVPRLKAEIVLTPVNGMPLVFTRRY